LAAAPRRGRRYESGPSRLEACGGRKCAPARLAVMKAGCHILWRAPGAFRPCPAPPRPCPAGSVHYFNIKCDKSQIMPHKKEIMSIYWTLTAICPFTIQFFRP
jgi:hypothetical protein